MRVQVAHTAHVDVTRLEEFHRMLVEAFADDPHGFTDADWNHCLGGMHAWVETPAGTLIAHACVVARRLLHQRRSLRCGYVEGVVVRAERRREGLAGRVLDEVERIVRGAYDLGALGATAVAVPLYRSHGWEPWRGPLSALAPEGIRPTPDD